MMNNVIEQNPDYAIQVRKIVDRMHWNMWDDKPKRPYISYKEAKEQASRTAKTKCNIYVCPVCDFLHIGRSRSRPEYSEYLFKERAVEERLAGRLIEALRKVLDRGVENS